MASLMSSSRRSPGRSSITSCGTPRSAVSRRAYATSSLPGAPTVKATQSGCMSWACSSVSELSRPPERMTPTVRSVSTRTRTLSSKAARTSFAASSGSSIVRQVLPGPQQVDIRHEIGPGRWLGPAMMARRHLRHRAAGWHQGLDLGGDAAGSHCCGTSTAALPRAGPGPGRRSLPARSTITKANSPRSRRTAPSPHCRNAVEQDLGVAGGAEVTAEDGELGAQLAVVEDLAVVAEQPPAVGRYPRLDRAPRSTIRSRCVPASRSSAHRVSSTSPRGASEPSILRNVAGVGTRSEDERDAAHGYRPPISASKPRRKPAAAAGLTHTCQACPSSMTLMSPAPCRSSSSDCSVRCAPNRRYQDISTSIA